MALKLWKSLKDESIIDIHEEPSCELINNEMHFYGGRPRRLKNANGNHVQSIEEDLISRASDAVSESEFVNIEERNADMRRNTSSNNSYKNCELEHNSSSNKSPLLVLRRDSLDKNETDTGIGNDSLDVKSDTMGKASNAEGENERMSRIGSFEYIQEKTNYMQRRLSGLSIEAISDALSEIGSTQEQQSHSRRSSLETYLQKGLTISTAMSELADQFIGAFEHEKDQCSEVSFPERRNNSVSLNLSDVLDMHDDSVLCLSDPSISSIDSKLAEKKFHLASVDAEKDKVAMEIRDNNAVLSQLQEQVLEKGDKHLYDKYENLDIEVNQLKESFEALLNEIHENDENSRKYMEQTEFLHATYETITNAMVKGNPCVGRKLP